LHGLYEEPHHLFSMWDSHGHEVDSPLLFVEVLVFNNLDDVVGYLEDSQLLLSHGYESIRTEVVDLLAKVVEHAESIRQYVQEGLVVSSAVRSSALNVKRNLRVEVFPRDCAHRSQI